MSDSFNPSGLLFYAIGFAWGVILTLFVMAVV